jgi:hypothetical protein
MLPLHGFVGLPQKTPEESLPAIALTFLDVHPRADERCLRDVRSFARASRFADVPCFADRPRLSILSQLGKCSPEILRHEFPAIAFGNLRLFRVSSKPYQASMPPRTPCPEKCLEHSSGRTQFTAYISLCFERQRILMGIGEMQSSRVGSYNSKSQGDTKIVCLRPFQKGWSDRRSQALK